MGRKEQWVSRVGIVARVVKTIESGEALKRDLSEESERRRPKGPSVTAAAGRS